MTNGSGLFAEQSVVLELSDHDFGVPSGVGSHVAGFEVEAAVLADWLELLA